MAVLFSDLWFEQLDKLNDEAGDLQLSPIFANIEINFKVEDPDFKAGGIQSLNLSAGKLQQGLIEAGKTTLLIDKDTLANLLQKPKMNAAIEAFIQGKIRVEGDMSQLMALQMTSLSSEQEGLYKAILQMTDLN